LKGLKSLKSSRVQEFKGSRVTGLQGFREFEEFNGSKVQGFKCSIV
jgi:hypothetical protein